MSRSNRRRFLQKALISGAGLSAVTRRSEAAFARTLSPLLLYALASAVLPAKALGEAGIERTIEGFSNWLARYELVAEMSHGYFSGEIRYSPEHPGPRWVSQLEALELEAQKRFSLSFVELEPEKRRELVAGQISEDRLNRLPRAADARHVAVGLLSYFYAQPETTDLAYQVRITPKRCRPLAMAPYPPEPLEDN